MSKQSNEPTIGPGMILERGRERWVLPWTWNGRDRTSALVYRRLWFRPWPSRWTDLYKCADEPHIRAMLLSGFKIIRPSDPQPKE